MKPTRGVKSMKNGEKLSGLKGLIKNYTAYCSAQYITLSSKKYNIPIKNREQLVMMSERIHRLMDEIEPSVSDENLQGGESDADLTEPMNRFC
jgi:hypothetical protein